MKKLMSVALLFALFATPSFAKWHQINDDMKAKRTLSGGVKIKSSNGNEVRLSRGEARAIKRMGSGKSLSQRQQRKLDSAKAKMSSFNE